MRSAKVYFIKPIGMDGPIKIGTSISPDNRRETLERWCPFPLEIAAVLDGGPKEERRLHDAFARFHINHEWFVAAPEIDAVIASINRGDFVFDSLPVAAPVQKFRRAYYDSPEYKYGCSVRTRIMHIERKGVPRSVIFGDALFHFDCAELLRNKDAVEARIARLLEQVAA